MFTSQASGNCRASLEDLVRNEGFDFDERDLGIAMATCMTEAVANGYYFYK